MKNTVLSPDLHAFDSLFFNLHWQLVKVMDCVLASPWEPKHIPFTLYFSVFFNNHIWLSASSLLMSIFTISFSSSVNQKRFYSSIHDKIVIHEFSHKRTSNLPISSIQSKKKNYKIYTKTKHEHLKLLEY